MSTTAQVRPATPADIAAVQRVAKQSWHATYRGMLSPQAIDTFLARAYSDYSLQQTLQSGGLWVLEAEGQIHGYLRLGVREKTGVLGAIYLLPSSQGRGFGRMLWEAALAWFKAQGVREITLTVAADNRRARGFYRHLGFVETHETAIELAGEPLREVTCVYALGP